MDHWNGWKNYGPRLYPGQVNIRFVYVSPFLVTALPHPIGTNALVRIVNFLRFLPSFGMPWKTTFMVHHQRRSINLSSVLLWIYALGRSPPHLRYSHQIAYQEGVQHPHVITTVLQLM